MTSQDLLVVGDETCETVVVLAAVEQLAIEHRDLRYQLIGQILCQLVASVCVQLKTPRIVDQLRSQHVITDVNGTIEMP